MPATPSSMLKAMTKVVSEVAIGGESDGGVCIRYGVEARPYVLISPSLSTQLSTIPLQQANSTCFIREPESLQSCMVSAGETRSTQIHLRGCTWIKRFNFKQLKSSWDSPDFSGAQKHKCFFSNGTDLLPLQNLIVPSREDAYVIKLPRWH